MAMSLSGRVSLIETCVSLLGHMADRLRYLQPSVSSLLEHLCAGQQFEKLPFLPRCRDLVHSGESFPDSWRRAVHECGGALGPEEREIMAALSDVLGAADLDSQLAALSFTRELMQARLEAARDKAGKYGKLYRSLGVLTGLALVILLA